ncbi:hypothetical protein IW262DRAFT_1453467 [Armillaria fumosa]|nr:hypothetical protein IW262DRAFT_1453467 [Armillaria fumosa]
MHAFQNEWTVHEYDAILHQFFNTIGITGEREMVNRLWTGLRNEIQVGLWRERLHPEYSSYTEVLEAAELIEIIENVSKARPGTRNHKSPDNQPVSGGNGKGNDNPPYPPKNRSSHKPSKGFKPSKDSRSPPGPSGNSSGNWNKSKSPPKHPELSEKEKEHRKTEGLCFRCGKSGHMSHQCLDGKIVKNGKSTSPPGLTSANVNINIEQLRELAETTEDIHELKVGMINTWLDSLEVGPDVYESEDESPVQQTVPDSSDSETEGNSHRMGSAATFQRGYGADPDSCILASKEIWQSMSREMDSGVKPKELSHFGGLFDRVKQVIDLYTSELAMISDSHSQDSALADAILHHFDNLEEN